MRLFTDSDTLPQAGSRARFGGRWRLTAAGLSNVWRFGDLRLPAPSGRLLMRGPNGTGKTTALEALWPYLLDLNAQRLAAGKARPTTLSSLMREGATGRRRYGYGWLTVASPADDRWSFGVRLQYSEGASPAVTVVPFAVPGEPLTDLPLHGPGRSALTVEEFTAGVQACGGQVFDQEEAYLAHLAARLWSASPADARNLAVRLRAVRNPTQLGDVSAKQAAEALRESLPGVDHEVITATAEALAESDATREAFERDREAARVLTDFAAVWSGHAVDVVSRAQADAAAAVDGVRQATTQVRSRAAAAARADQAAEHAETQARAAADAVRDARATITALEQSKAYQAAGRLADLTGKLAAQTEQAKTSLRQLTSLAAAAADRGTALRRTAADLADDLGERTDAAASAAAEAAEHQPLLRWQDRPRPALRVGDATADPGPALALDADPQRLHDVASAWTGLAETYRLRAADAGLALTDLRPVTAAETRAGTAAATARRAADHADEQQQTAARRAASAAEAAGRFLTDLQTWIADHPHLVDHPPPAAGNHPDGPDGDPGEFPSVEELSGLAAAEPAQILAAGGRWQPAAVARGAHLAAAFRGEAQQASAQADELRSQAAALRAQAAELRAGRLLPLPGPAWAPDGDQARAFGAALDWQPDFTTAEARARIELALATSGALGAQLSTDGAATPRWHIHPAGPPAEPNLGAVLQADPTHPDAPAAAVVLQRIPLLPTATAAADDAAGLLIGRDGTYRTGLLTARPPELDDPHRLPAAQHIGAAQRRAAAMRLADGLTEHAAQLDDDAAGRDAAAAAARQHARNVDTQTAAFPPLTALHQAEAGRAAAANTSRAAAAAADTAHAQARTDADTAAQARQDWAARTAGRGLPTDPAELAGLRDQGTTVADRLHTAAAAVAGKLHRRLDQLLHDVAADGEHAAHLDGLQAAAQAARDEAAVTAQTVRTLQTTAGQAAEEAVAQHAAARRRAAELHRQQEQDQTRRVDAAREQTAARAQLTAAEEQLAAAQPSAAQRVGELRQLLAVPGVADVALPDQPAAADNRILTQLAAALPARRTAARKTVRERYDEARATLAGTWTLAVGDTHGDLDTYVLTHTDLTYTPPQAAVRAHALHDKAQAALAAAEETALRDFVIGRLPAAIGLAWTRLHDWVRDVNRKMRAAEASSGVGVQVQLILRDDLSPAVRTVYELSCRVADADRTPEQATRVGDALQRLLTAADGDAMVDRLADAVDVRGWVDVHYQVTRPGAAPQRWGPKTGLSGGERRLVVLAPMLAAVAAAYDNFPTTGLRLAALDEVPAEVDERGREGLARYLAELDLDLLCTSYLWDGAPGAWDGIDAHDLEAAPDGTVVAFPMLVRGLPGLPGDPEWDAIR